MITVFLSWTIIFMIFLSFGEMAVRLWNTITKRNDSYSITDKFWIGICVVGTILLYISIFAPLNIWVLAGFVLTSLLYILIEFNVFKEKLALAIKNAKSATTYQKILFVATLVTILIYSLSAPNIYDDSLYHLQTMQWAEKYRTVLGLGNLHGRLAFNSSFLLLSTLFNYHPTVFYTAFTLNSLCLCVFTFWLIRQLRKTENLVTILSLSFILIISVFSLGAIASSSSTDGLPSIFIMYILLKWTIYINTTKKNAEDFTHRYPFLIAALAAFCITLKLSSSIILLALLICLVTLIIKKDKSTIWSVIILGLLIAIPWCTRFVMYTGYLVYPFPGIDIFSFDWKIPIEMVINEKDITYSWSRIPNVEAVKVLNMSITEWVPIWAKNLSAYTRSLYLLAVISPIYVLLIIKNIKKRHNIIVWLIAYLGVVFNLFTAPDIRFALGSVICAIVLPLMLHPLPFFKLGQNKLARVRFATYTILTICILILSNVAYSQMKYYNKRQTRKIGFGLLYKPLPIDIQKKMANTTYEEYTLNNTTIFIPKGNDRCFDQSIPCTPFYNSNLEMRGNDIRDGFRIKK